MTATAPDVDQGDTFLTDGRPYLNARQAATYCGYEPTPGVHARDDKQMKAFYAWASLRGLHPQPGRSVYRRVDLDTAIRQRRGQAAPADIEAMRQLARDDVADRRRRARLQLRRSSETA